MIEIEPAAMRNSGRCGCCGKVRRTVWGFVYRDGGPRACYFVEWTLGHPGCAARVDVVVGEWFDGTTESDRDAVAMEYRAGDLAVVDAAGRPAAEVGLPRTRVEVVGTPLADEASEIARAVIASDARVEELR